MTCKLHPIIEGGANPCSCCPTIPTQATMDKVIAVGFGSAVVTCDGDFIADGEHGRIIRNGIMEKVEPWSITFGDIEEMAAALGGEHDWRIELHGPLHGETYQRQGPGVWLCIERNEGFA